MLSTNRRRVLAVGTGLLVGPVAGCGSIRQTGVKYTLYMNPSTDEVATEERVLDFDHANLSPGERDVVESAIEDEEYTEGYVDWGGTPNRTAISEPFKSVILRLVDHKRSTVEKDRGTPRVGIIDVDTHSRYDGTIYETRITSNSAE